MYLVAVIGCPAGLKRRTLAWVLLDVSNIELEEKNKQGREDTGNNQQSTHSNKEHTHTHTLDNMCDRWLLWGWLDQRQRVCVGAVGPYLISNIEFEAKRKKASDDEQRLST